ncbi:hypothetical protein GUJ93_ZPchr0013g36979 [Zizania palustris]|uniref:Pre-mRNA-splicing factor 38 n=1 Tax=Zizania palustris TaxID=103762 RepID=A0A8J5X5M8_ZIZPA|nr:hypothetical protein GUJ93_ZPchr0013g36979 [Zizania palustris]
MDAGSLLAFFAPGASACRLAVDAAAATLLSSGADVLLLSPHPHRGEMEIQSSGRPIDVLMEKVIDEIYNQVDHVKPWMTGNCRGPSSAFCLLYKFFTMKLTIKQIGFLYMRYVVEPKTLWSWYEPYIKDDEIEVFNT